MVSAYEAYVIHYASFSRLLTSLVSVGGTVAAVLPFEGSIQRNNCEIRL